MPIDNPTIDVIVRFHNPEKSDNLSRALFSLYGQTYRAVQPLLILQDFSLDELEALERLIDGFPWNQRRRRPSVYNYIPDVGGDYRSALVNKGFGAGQGRYIAILDYDDVVYRHAYEHLIHRLTASNAAIAFGRIAVKHVYPLGQFEYVQSTTRVDFKGDGLSDLFRYNFCPIHSFVLDRTKIAAEDLYFDETMTRMEDYDFLLRICVKYRSDFKGLSHYVGTYYWRIDGSNTIDPYREVEDGQRDWDVARERIHALKARLGIASAL
jgi:hypothetical protein